MSRNQNTDRNGGPFNQSIIDAVWAKGILDPKYPGYRKDRCGAYMKKEDYGKTTDYGWEIDHKKSVSHDGSDNLENLQPLQWQNNRHKGDDYPNWNCAIKN